MTAKGENAACSHPTATSVGFGFRSGSAYLDRKRPAVPVEIEHRGLERACAPRPGSDTPSDTAMSPSSWSWTASMSTAAMQSDRAATARNESIASLAIVFEFLESSSNAAEQVSAAHVAGVLLQPRRRARRRGIDSDIGSGRAPYALWRGAPVLGSSRPALPRGIDPPLAGCRHPVASEAVNAVLQALRATLSLAPSWKAPRQRAQERIRRIRLSIHSTWAVSPSVS